jgi:hypothetical protein
MENVNSGEGGQLFHGQRSSISFRIASAQRTVSEIAATVAGTLFPQSKLDSFLAAKIAVAISNTHLPLIHHRMAHLSLCARHSPSNIFFQMVRSKQKGVSGKYVWPTVACASLRSATDVMERFFFGMVDRLGMSAVTEMAEFAGIGTLGGPDAFRNLPPYMGAQRFRTPRAQQNQMGIAESC